MTTTFTRTRTVGVKKIIRALDKRTPGPDGKILVNIFSISYKTSVTEDTEPFWSFKPTIGCVQMNVIVHFDPTTEQMILACMWRRAIDFSPVTVHEKTIEDPTWPFHALHEIPIDDIVEYGLKSPLMIELGLKAKPPGYVS